MGLRTRPTSIAFADRRAAGRRLAARLGSYRDRPVVVLGIPRGGVPVAHEVAQALGAPLDVVVVRKLGLPTQPELAMGALGEGGYGVLDGGLMRRAGVTHAQEQAVEARERQALDARVARIRRGRPPMDLTGRVAVVVDDGLATGATAEVACEVVRRRGAARVVLAVPVAPADALQAVAGPDEVVCLVTPSPFYAVGEHYRDFTATSDDEVVGLLEQARPAAPPTGHEVTIEVGPVSLEALLHPPVADHGVVVLVHGSGSNRHSPRNAHVAAALRDAGLGTVLLDLLTTDEQRAPRPTADLAVVAGRVGATTRWLAQRPDTAGAAVGLLGSSTGAAVALWAAGDPGVAVDAVVARGGRPDLAGPRLGRVTVPTLLIVGGADHEVLRLNREAQARLGGPSRLEVVPGAGHLFEEPGALAQAASLAKDWFVTHLSPAPGGVTAEADTRGGWP